MLALNARRLVILIVASLSACLKAARLSFIFIAASNKKICPLAAYAQTCERPRLTPLALLSAPKAGLSAAETHLRLFSVST
jgi:hypothetical protein